MNNEKINDTVKKNPSNFKHQKSLIEYADYAAWEAEHVFNEPRTLEDIKRLSIQKNA